MVAVRLKAPELLQNTRGGRGRGVSVLGRPADWRPPSLPREVTAPLADPVQARFQPAAVKHARLIWREWWDSAPSEAVDLKSDREAVTWWIICVFRRSLYIQVLREQPLVKGSQGQPVTNPLERTIHGLTRDIGRSEARFGMTTLDRFRLHVEAQGQQSHDEGDDALVDEYRRMLAE